MKKVVSVALVVLMVLSMSVCALAETWTHEASGITIDLPDGMVAEDISDEFDNDALVCLYVSTGNDATHYYLFMEYAEEFDGKWMEDLDAETVHALGEYYATTGKAFDYQTYENGEHTFLLMKASDDSEAIVVALLNGWFISVETLSDNDEALNEATYDDIDTLLASIRLPE